MGRPIHGWTRLLKGIGRRPTIARSVYRANKNPEVTAMRPLILVSILALAAFSGQAAPAQERAGKGRTNMFRAAYEAPKDPKHQVYYEQLRKARLLERFSEALASMRLPKPLSIKF